MNDGKGVTEVSAEPIIYLIDNPLISVLDVGEEHLVSKALGAGPKALLVVLTKRDVPLGLILLMVGDAARKISRLVD